MQLDKTAAFTGAKPIRQNEIDDALLSGESILKRQLLVEYLHACNDIRGQIAHFLKARNAAPVDQHDGQAAVADGRRSRARRDGCENLEDGGSAEGAHVLRAERRFWRRVGDDAPTLRGDDDVVFPLLGEGGRGGGERGQEGDDAGGLRHVRFNAWLARFRREKYQGTATPAA